MIGRAGPHGDCGLRDPVAVRLLVGVRVQLFDVGAFDFLRHRHSFNFWLLQSEANEKVLFFFGCQLPYRRDPDRFSARTALKQDLIETCADTARGRVCEGDAPAAAKPVGPALQRDMIRLACRRIDDEILLIQNPVSSDTWLIDAITSSVTALAVVLAGACTS